MFKYHVKPNIYVNHIVLKVVDITRSREFYTKVMGFKILEEKENEVTLTADGITPIVSLIEPNDVVPKMPRRTGVYHFALLLPDNFQLGLFLKHLRDEGYPIVGGSHHGVSEAVYLQDPDDNGIEVYADTDSDSWEWTGDKVNMVTLPLDYDKLIGNTGDAKWEGIPGKSIIGHLHLHVADLEESKKFYVDGMGLDIVAEIPRSAIFTSSGGYHHHIAFNIWNGRGAKPLPDNAAGMKYFSVTFPDEEARSKRIREMEKLGYKVFEENKDLYVKDPSENLIKLVV